MSSLAKMRLCFLLSDLDAFYCCSLSYRAAAPSPITLWSLSPVFSGGAQWEGRSLFTEWRIIKTGD